MAALCSTAHRLIGRFLILICALAPGLCRLSAQLPGRGLAVVVGINQYQQSAHWPTLKLAENDARDLAAALESHGFEVTLLTGAQSTKHNILQALYSFSRGLQPDDHIVFFFAGHGFGETPSNGKPRRGYIVPYDGADYASYISSSELEDISENLDAAHHQLFLIDSCYAGLIHTRAANPDEPSDPKYIQNLNERDSREVLAASGQDQETPDSGFDGRDSYFVNALLEALSGQADYNRDGYITFSELETYVVTRASNRYSTPAYGAFPGSGGGEFIFNSPHGRLAPAADVPKGDIPIPRHEADQPPAPVSKPFAPSTVASSPASSSEVNFWGVYDAALSARGAGKIRGHVTSPSGAPQTSGTMTLSWFGTDRVSFPIGTNGDYSGEAPAGTYNLIFRQADTPRDMQVDHIDSIQIKAGYVTTIDDDRSHNWLLNGLLPEERDRVLPVLKQQQHDREDWERSGVAGRVQAIGYDNRILSLANCAGSPKPTTLIALASGADVRRYSDTSPRLADATSAHFDQINVGDILLARGSSTGPGQMAASEIIYGPYPGADLPDIVTCK